MKKQIGFLNAFISSSKAKKMTIDEIKKLQEERAKKLIEHARANSRFYQEKYSGLSMDCSFESLPPVNKRELMARFEDWITDKSIHFKNLKEFIKSSENIGRPYMGKYLVATTSGSTGVPAVFLYDNNNLNVMDALAVTRAMAYKGIMMKLVKAGGKSAAIYATGGHYLGVASVRYKQFKNPAKAKQISVFSVLSPIEEIVRNLNDFQPALLGGYPTALELLIPEKLSGRLDIHPVLINTGGEYLSRELSESLSKTFGCPVQSSYSCTEGGFIAFQCSEGHQHVNTDWVIFEPVDSNNHPVPAGVLSDKILLTNLANFVQPIIRYEVTDRVRFLKDSCPCGSRFPVIEVEGRTDDILEFNNGNVKVPPLAVYVLLKEVPNVIRFQVVLKDNNHIELKLETSGDRETVANEAVKRFEAFLREKGVSPVITLSKDLPAPALSGKFRHISKETSSK